MKSDEEYEKNSEMVQGQIEEDRKRFGADDKGWIAAVKGEKGRGSAFDQSHSIGT